MKQYLTLKQLEAITDYQQILEAAQIVKNEYSKILKFLVKMGLKQEAEKISIRINSIESEFICSRWSATRYYLELKVAVCDLSLIIHQKSYRKIYEIYEVTPHLIFRTLNDFKKLNLQLQVLNDIHFEPFNQKIKAINTYICNGSIYAVFNN